MDLKTASIPKLFYKYLIPSVTGTLSVGILIFIDTLFIGRGIGGLGLAALTIVLPVFTLYSSMGLLLGMGGATVGSIEEGQGNKNGLKIAFTNAFLLAALVSVVLTILQIIFLNSMVLGLGGRDEVYSFVLDYLKILSIFTIFYLVPHVMNVFIRNDNNPNLAMVGMIVCGIVNICLDYIFIFIFGWEMGGAALATGIAQVAYTIVLSLHFVSRKNTLKLLFCEFKYKRLKKIIEAGFPSFITDAFGGVVIFLVNGALFALGGSIAVSAYSIVLNINWMIHLLYLGVAQAAQPIISINYGYSLKERTKEIVRLGVITTASLGVFLYVMIYMFRRDLVNLFISGGNDELLRITVNGIPLFFIAIIFMGFNLFMGTYLQAIIETKLSMFIMLIRGIGLTLVLLYPLSKYYGINGIWLTPSLAEGVTTLIIIWWIKKKVIVVN